ncbi:putative peptidoglycan lipid II flippase [Thermoflexales bacterium]|nr:putative peptidoglycan lipid II flippase [Thermoflexales bacterium]
MATFLVSRLLGLLRDVVIGAQFGTSGDYDAYVAAFRIPDIIYTLIAGGILMSAFLPTFTDYLAQEDRSGAWRLASAVINLVVVVLAAIALLAALLAEPIVRYLLAPGFGPEAQALTVQLMRLLLIPPIIFAVSGVVMGILYAHQSFWLPGLAPSMYNLGIIFGALVLAPFLDVFGLAIGAIIGAVLHLLIQVPGLRRVGAQYSTRLAVRDPGVREVMRLMLPRMFGVAVVQLTFLVETILASWLTTGAVSALNYAWRLMLLPQGVVAQSVATAAFPTFANQYARGQFQQLRSSLAATVRSILFIAIPAAIGLLALREPIVQLLFERGRFTTTSTEIVAAALGGYALGLIGHSGVEILARAFYALHDTRTPVLLGVLALGIDLIIGLSLINVLGVLGLALANMTAASLEMILLVVVIRRRLGGLDDRRLTISALRTTLASLAMGVVVWGWLSIAAGAAVLVRAIGGVLVGTGVFFIAAWLLRSEELRGVLGMVRRRLGR